MKFMVVAALLFFVGLAQASQVLDIRVQAFDLPRDQPSSTRWEEYSGIPLEKAVVAINEVQW